MASPPHTIPTAVAKMTPACRRYHGWATIGLGGAAVEMPTPFDTFGPAAHHGSTAGTEEGRAHRETLRQAMVQAGFRPNRMEWWHYDAPERRGAPLLDVALVPGP